MEEIATVAYTFLQNPHQGSGLMRMWIHCKPKRSNDLEQRRKFLPFLGTQRALFKASKNKEAWFRGVREKTWVSPTRAKTKVC